MVRYPHHHTQRTSGEEGFALPAALLMMVIVLGVTTILGTLSTEGLRRTESQVRVVQGYFAAEGAINQAIAEMSSFGNLWDQQASLGTIPSGYSEYAPNAFASNNGVPTCATGPACHRNFVPTGGGLLKNYGPLDGDGRAVNSTLPITQQLNQNDAPEPDVVIDDIPAWVQIERLDETLPSASVVGGNLSSSLAEAGNAKEVFFRLTGTALVEARGRISRATVVSVVRMPVM